MTARCQPVSAAFPSPVSIIKLPFIYKVFYYMETKATEKYKKKLITKKEPDKGMSEVF